MYYGGNGFCSLIGRRRSNIRWTAVRIPRVLIAAAFAACAVTPVYADMFSDNIVISLCHGIPVDGTTGARYDQLMQAGINVTNVPCVKVVWLDKKGRYTREANLAILDMCAERGIKAVIHDARIHARPSDPDFHKNLDAVVADYSSHPGLWGYYVEDEPHTGEFGRLAATVSYLRSKNSKHVPWINLFPNYATPEQTKAPDYESYVDQYLDTVKPPMLCFDHYSQMTEFAGNRFFDNIEIIRDRAIEHKIPFMVIFLVTSHGPFRNPSMADLRWQVYNSLAYGAKGLVYYTYWLCHCGASGVIDAEGDTTKQYAQVQELNAQVKALSPTLVKLRSDAVYHVGDVPSGARTLPEHELITSVGGAKAVVALFTDDQDGRYIMLVNKDMRAAHDIHFTFRTKVLLHEVSQATGKNNIVGEDLSFTLRFLAGEGRLFAVKELKSQSVPELAETSAQSPTANK